jgi:outer membrane usher protein FimD/PapC
MRYSDNIHHGTWVGYHIRNPFSIFRNFYLNMNYWMYWDYSGKLLSTSFNTNFNTQFKNKWYFNASITKDLEIYPHQCLEAGHRLKVPEALKLTTMSVLIILKKFRFIQETIMDGEIKIMKTITGTGLE